MKKEVIMKKIGDKYTNNIFENIKQVKVKKLIDKQMQLQEATPWLIISVQK